MKWNSYVTICFYHIVKIWYQDGSLSMPLYCPYFVSAVMPVPHAVWLTTECLIGIASCILTRGRYGHYALSVQFFDCLLRFIQIHHNSLIGHTLTCPYRRKKEWIFQFLRFHADRQAGYNLEALRKFEADQISAKWSSIFVVFFNGKKKIFIKNTILSFFRNIKNHSPKKIHSQNKASISKWLNS